MIGSIRKLKALRDPGTPFWRPPRETLSLSSYSCWQHSSKAAICSNHRPISQSTSECHKTTISCGLMADKLRYALCRNSARREVEAGRDKPTTFIQLQGLLQLSKWDGLLPSHWPIKTQSRPQLSNCTNLDLENPR
jgi:hypothetical protein